MRKSRIPLIFFLALGAVGYFAFWNQPPKDDTKVLVSGNIEVATVDVSFKIPGKIERLLVEEGDFVREGQLIATLEHRDLLAQRAKAEAALEAIRSRIPAIEKTILFQDQATLQEIAQAQAAAEAARAKLQQLLSGSRPQEIEAAKAAVDQAYAELEKRRADMMRAKSLFQSQYISAQEWDSARTAYEAARANHQRAKENWALVMEGPRREEIEQARAQVEETQARLRLAQAQRLQIEILKKELDTARAQVKEAAAAISVIESQIEYCNLRAPMNGVVLVKNSEPGEYAVPGGPVITLGDLERPWLKAYIHEAELGKVKLGQKVAVTTDTFPGRIYEGRITFISSEAEFTPKNVQTAKERVKLVYRIKVSLANPRNELKPGMPADGQIQIEGK
jgi:HlyD family secretion protein